MSGMSMMPSGQALRMASASCFGRSDFEGRIFGMADSRLCGNRSLANRANLFRNFSADHPGARRRGGFSEADSQRELDFPWISGSGDRPKIRRVGVMVGQEELRVIGQV